MLSRCKIFIGVFMPASSVIFGVGKLHHLPMVRARQKVIEAAFDVGFRAFDVAPSYGNGINEVEIGMALRGKRDACEINTKFGIPIKIYGSWARHFFSVRRLADKVAGQSAHAYQNRNFSAKELESSLDQSLGRLKTDYIDTFFVHEPISQMTQNQVDEIFESSERMKKKGKIKAIGIAGPMESIRYCPSVEIFDVVQMPFVDLKNADTVISCKKVILYGAYRAYRDEACTDGFAQFVKNSIASHAGVRVIVSSKSVQTISTFSEIFYENY